MDAILIQILNGLDKGAAYALIALGLTLAFGTLGIVNFAHGALFMLGAFCAVVFQKILTTSVKIKDESVTLFDAYKEQPYLEIWFGDFGASLVDWAVPLSIIMAIPVMILIGIAMERGLIKHFYKRTHAEQILVTFGLAIVIQEIVKAFFGANPIPTPAPDIVSGSAAVGAWFGLSDNLVYPWWRLIYIRMADRETVGLLGINIQKRFTIVFAIAALVAGLAGVMYAPILPPDYHMGMDFLVLSFVVVVVGGMGSLGGAVAAGFLLGILQSFASMNEVKSLRGLIMKNLFKSNAVIMLVFSAVVLTAPMWTTPLGANYPDLLQKFAIFGLFAVGYNILFGLTGYLSFGHAAFLGIGSYTAVWAMKLLTMNVFVGVVLAIIVSGIFALIIGYLSLRRSGIYFSILTLAFAQMAYSLAYSVLTPITNGESGLQLAAEDPRYLDSLLGVTQQAEGIPATHFFGFLIKSMDGYFGFYFAAVVLIIGFYIALKIFRSPFGLKLKAIKSNQTRMTYTGFNTRPYLLSAFVISGMYAGLAGALMASIDPLAGAERMQWTASGEVVLMTNTWRCWYLGWPINRCCSYQVL
ncbi:High-affinity branched-chain amino acid transport system permease protein BraE [Nymphon striatum]|nr:High-affinity branched-chain amino acid transport system permease protein BraE [Nymphon striatum]